MCRRLPQFLKGACVLLLISTQAAAELTVTVNISGPIDELLPVLEYLRQQGAGPGGSAEDSPMKVEVHSVHGAPEANITPESAAPAPALSLGNPQAEPGTMTPGSPVLIRLEVRDEQKAVDTVTARLVEANLEVDLFDNGSNGDAAAGDGVWSAYALAPEDLAAGTYTVEFVAYDKNGSPVQTAGADGAHAPLTAQMKMEAVRSEAPAEAAPTEAVPAEATPAEAAQ